MNLGIDKDVETIPLQVTLMDREVLRVTADGQFVWNPDADRMIEEGDFTASPAMPFILKALRKREWVGLTDEEIKTCAKEHIYCEDSHYNVEDGIDGWDDFAQAIEAKLRKKNGL